jgi:hypothetical protein
VPTLRLYDPLTKSYPELNTHCHAAVEAYRACLSADETFQAVTLERFVECLQANTSAEWVDELKDRYLAWDKIDRVLGDSSDTAFERAQPRPPERENILVAASEVDLRGRRGGASTGGSREASGRPRPTCPS